MAIYYLTIRLNYLTYYPTVANLFINFLFRLNDCTHLLGNSRWLYAFNRNIITISTFEMSFQEWFSHVCPLLIKYKIQPCTSWLKVMP